MENKKLATFGIVGYVSLVFMAPIYVFSQMKIFGLLGLLAMLVVIYFIIAVAKKMWAENKGLILLLIFLPALDIFTQLYVYLGNINSYNYFLAILSQLSNIARVIHLIVLILIFRKLFSENNDIVNNNSDSVTKDHMQIKDPLELLNNSSKELDNKNSS